MAKSDSFFIRASLLVDNTGAHAETEIDLGSFVNLGISKSTLLRIHNIAVQFSDENGNAAQVQAGSDSAACQYQLTTQSQTDTVLSSDKSVIATGIVYAINAFSSDEFPELSHDMDMLPQLWTNGYLIGVDTIYWAGEASSGWVAADNVTISCVLECTLENATQASSTALALSQQ